MIRIEKFCCRADTPSAILLLSGCDDDSSILAGKATQDTKEDMRRVESPVGADHEEIGRRIGGRCSADDCTQTEGLEKRGQSIMFLVHGRRFNHVFLKKMIDFMPT